jgi:hypothetical protein
VPGTIIKDKGTLVAPTTPLDLPPEFRGLFLGDTGSGKSTQLAELCLHLGTTGEGLTSVVMLADKGSMGPYRPLVKAGLTKVYAYDPAIDPWIWIGHAVKGEAKVDGKWVKVVEPGRDGLMVGEGLTAFSELLMMDMARLSAEDPSKAIGGEAAWTHEARDGDEVAKVSGSTRSHYGLAQLRIMNEIHRTDPGVASFWTAALQRSTDDIGSGGILSAEVAGKAMGPKIPRWFDRIFRINAEATKGSAVHTLYLETHLDKLAKNAKAMSNARLSLRGAEVAPVPSSFQPADLVQALLQIQRRDLAAVTEITSARQAFLKAKGEK